MFQKSANISLKDRTIGVIERNDKYIQTGYNLMSIGKETYLFDSDGRVVHEWTSERSVFCSYLLPNGNLLRDGSENIIAVGFRTGGAAGFVEEVTWEGERVWSHLQTPISQYLTHHDLQPLPNGNVLVLSWERKTRDEAIAAGRRPELIPDNEVWNNIIMELKPNRNNANTNTKTDSSSNHGCGIGDAEVVWQWSVWDHLIQDYDSTKANYGDIAAHPECFDINCCPAYGKAGARDQSLLTKSKNKNDIDPNNTGSFGSGVTGERDWLHINCISYDPIRDQIAMSCNVHGELVIIDHSTTMVGDVYVYIYIYILVCVY